MQEKVVFVDVDSTLWDFGEELRNRLQKRFPDKEIPANFRKWDEPMDFFHDPQEAYDMFNDIHAIQHTFTPFKAASLVLKDLRRLGYKILIATNRIPESEVSLIRWLNDNDLIYDDVFCGLNKHKLLDERDIDLVIDDAPHIIDAAINKDIPIMSLRYPYNSQIRDVKKFKDMKEMHEYLIQQLIMSI